MGHYLGIVVSFLYGRSDGYAESCTAVFAELLQSERKRCEERREQQVAEKNESREAVPRAGVEANTAVKDEGKAGKR